MSTFRFEAVKPDALDKLELYKPLRVAMLDIQEEIKETFGTTTEDFDHPVDFEGITLTEVDKITTRVETDDLIYFFLTRGTSVRYATMTPNFQSKTVPGRLSTRGGRGGVWFINKRQPRPGIKARNFDILARNIIEPVAQERVNQGMVEAAKRSNHSI